MSIFIVIRRAQENANYFNTRYVVFRDTAGKVRVERYNSDLTCHRPENAIRVVFPVVMCQTCPNWAQYQDEYGGDYSERKPDNCGAWLTDSTRCPGVHPELLT